MCVLAEFSSIYIFKATLVGLGYSISILLNWAQDLPMAYETEETCEGGPSERILILKIVAKVAVVFVVCLFVYFLLGIAVLAGVVWNHYSLLAACLRLKSTLRMLR